MTWLHLPIGNEQWDSAAARGHDEGPWSRWYSWAWQAAADPEGRRPVPPTPSSTGDQDDLIAYWGPLLHLTSYGLGWTDPGAGLLRWQERGADVSDTRLSLIARWWGPALPDFLAFALAADDLSALGAQISELAGAHPGRAREQRLQSQFDPTVDRILTRCQDPAWQRTWSGGYDPLHLTQHALGPVRPEGPRQVRLAIERPGQAVLTTSRYDGWYVALADHGRQLPPLPNGRSWRISVLCVPVGYLGTYRQSHVTGRWFAGRHRWHQLGG